MTKQEILTQALAGREQELLAYQVNIDNYRLAIEHIDAGGDTDLVPFREQLASLLQSEILEQKKARVIRDVIAQQLEA